MLKQLRCYARFFAVFAGVRLLARLRTASGAPASSTASFGFLEMRERSRALHRCRRNTGFIRQISSVL
jgi:hypothetical protein